uniref:Uncharacterized protein n=1 Tax=Globodera rostochiensis TaxID=31243 RepID=A0A914GYZ6_GLORO
MTKSLLFSCCCAIIVCLALMAQDKSVLAISNDGGESRIARFFEGGESMRVKRACSGQPCSPGTCDEICNCFKGHCRAQMRNEGN